jgi:hypothetical protein
MGCDFMQQLAKHQLHWKPPASALSIPGMNAEAFRAKSW